MLPTVPNLIPGSVTEAIGTSKTSLICSELLQVDWAEGGDTQNFEGCLFNAHLTSLLIGSDGQVPCLTVWPTQILLNTLNPEHEKKQGTIGFKLASVVANCGHNS